MSTFKKILLGTAAVVVGALISVVLGSRRAEPSVREFSIKARQYAYEPPKIRVNKGDEVHIKLMSLDVIHGFFLEGYDIDAEIEPGRPDFKVRKPSTETEFHRTPEIVFVANKTGKFRYRCSHTCGYLHPFMLGEMIVDPNYTYLAGIGGTAGLTVAFFSVLLLNGRSRRSPEALDPTEAENPDSVSEGVEA